MQEDCKQDLLHCNNGNYWIANLQQSIVHINQSLWKENGWDYRFAIIIVPPCIDPVYQSNFIRRDSSSAAVRESMELGRLRCKFFLAFFPRRAHTQTHTQMHTDTHSPSPSSSSIYVLTCLLTLILCCGLLFFSASERKSSGQMCYFISLVYLPLLASLPLSLSVQFSDYYYDSFFLEMAQSLHTF